MQLTVEEGYFLFKETVLKNYLDGDIPAEPERNKDFTEQIEEAVKKQKEWFGQVTKLYKTMKVHIMNPLEQSMVLLNSLKQVMNI